MTVPLHQRLIGDAQRIYEHVGSVVVQCRTNRAMLDMLLETADAIRLFTLVHPPALGCFEFQGVTFMEATLPRGIVNFHDKAGDLVGQRTPRGLKAFRGFGDPGLTVAP